MKSNNNASYSLLFGSLAGMICLWLFFPIPEKVTQERSHPSGSPESKNLPLIGFDKEPLQEDNNALEKQEFSETDGQALSNELVAQFDSEDAFNAALEKARALGIPIKSELPKLRAIRFALENDAQRKRLQSLLGDDAKTSYNYSVALPPLPENRESGDVLTGSQAFGATTLDFLGIDSPQSDWGTGIKVAVLDSGIDTSHPTFEGASLNTLTLKEGDSKGHGTAVASLIAGQSETLPGIAPGAELLNIQVIDSSGSGDTFSVAEGVLAAADAGAKIINLSLGSNGDSSVLREAIDYAQSKGAIIVAAAGNEGVDQIPYPAAYDGVIAVAAVDAQSQTADFSNFSNSVDIAAPGVGVYAAWEDAQAISFSGTSASTPLVSGALAVLLSEEPNLTTDQAIERLLSQSDDTGPPGKDQHSGNGILNVDRILNANTPGIYDAAIAGYHIDLENTSGEAIGVKVTVQNRGTEPLYNLQLKLNLEGRNETLFLGNLNPSEITTSNHLLNPFPILEGDGTLIRSTIEHEGAPDSRPENDSKASLIRLQ